MITLATTSSQGVHKSFHAGRNLDESFVMLAGSASVLHQGHGGHLRASNHGVPLQALDDHFAQLARTFEIASGETAVSLSPHLPHPSHSLQEPYTTVSPLLVQAHM